MRWMKHMTAAWQDEKIARMVDEGGIESYGFYWRMLEIVAANMTETSNPVCQLPAKSWARLCNLLSNRFERLSQLLAKCGLCRLDTFEGLLKVEFPNLVKYRDEYSKKRGKADDKTPDKVRSVSGQCPDQEQIQKLESKHKQKHMRTAEAEAPAEFEIFWESYPRHIDKKRALKAWKARIKDGYSPDAIHTAAKNYAAHCRTNKTEEKFIKHPATFAGPDLPFLDWQKQVVAPAEEIEEEPDNDLDEWRISCMSPEQRKQYDRVMSPKQKEYYDLTHPDEVKRRQANANAA